MIKKLNILFLAIAMMLVLPMSVFATDEVDAVSDEGTEVVSEESDEVKFYFFWGNGCSYCDLEKDFLASIEDEYGHLFEVIDYETWEDADNAALMEEVISTMGQDSQGVPFTIIGNQTWVGYMDDYAQEMIDAIVEESEIPVNERYDVMDFVDASYLDSSTANTIEGLTGETQEEESGGAALVITLLVIGGIVGLIIYTRKNM